MTPRTSRRRVPPLAVDAAAAVGLAAVLLPWTHLSLQPAAGSATDVTAVGVVFGVLHACVVLRRRAPNVGYAIGCVAILTIVLMPPQRIETASGDADLPLLFLPSSLVFLVLLEAIGAQRGRRLARAGLAVAVAGALGSSLVLGAHVPAVYPVLRYRVYLAGALVLAVSAAWGVGAARRRARLRDDERREAATLAALAGERARIAADMHDLVAHSLAVIVRQADGGLAVAAARPDRAVATLSTVADVARSSLGEMRRLVRVLRDPEDADPGAGPMASARRVGRADLAPIVAAVSEAGVRVEVVEVGDAPVPDAVEAAAQHVVREALTNVLKHAGPGASARVLLRRDAAGLVVEVTDDGGAAQQRRHRESAREALPGAGVGLLGLAERVAALGGTFTAVPTRGGFVVRALFACGDAGQGG